AGAGVADGYWNRPELTAERFVPDPFAPAGGERPDGQPARMYRTGDTARWNAHGLLEFGGRSDGQVKVRGHRVELREVELALGTHDAVGEVAVVVSNPGGADAALVAYVTPANGHACEPPQLLAHLAQRLPGYMAPSAVIQLPELPKTENGKIDRNRLPRRGIAGQGSAPKLAPRTPLEQQLSAWVCELLRIDHAGPFDNFFELGGQSLLATQLVVRMRDELGVEPPLRAVYEDPTIAAWAELILEAQITTTADLPGDLLRQIGEMTDAQAAEFLQSLGKRPSGER
ncbi:MAG: phosphopantetheine-binding protein, partial [Planctomycetota bacterium]